MKQGKRLEYENNSNTINNLNREESLVTNFIQLVSLQPVDQFLQTKLYCKAPNKKGLSVYMQDVQKQQQTTKILDHQ